MAYSDMIVSLAVDAQRQHADLIEEANRRTSSEARFEIQDQLNSVRRSFMASALSVLGLVYPMQLNPLQSEDHALVVAINDDFEDSIAQLKALRDQGTLYKTVKAVTASPFSSVTLPSVEPSELPWWVWVVGLLAVAAAFRPR